MFRPNHNPYAMYQANCVECGGTTNKKYAREHDGRCKSCFTGEDQTKLYECPDCGERRLTAYQKAHRYHCDSCTRNVE